MREDQPDTDDSETNPRNTGSQDPRLIEPQDTEFHEPENLEQLLDTMAKAAEGVDQVSFEKIIDAVGKRAFGPLLLMVGILMTSPVSGIPGLPTTMATLVVLTGVQLLMGRDSFWLPQWLLRRSLASSKLQKGVKWLKRPARVIDHALKPRLTFLIHRVGQYVIALVCILIALSVPPLEIVPFLATTTGLVLTIFGLALVAYDGALALLAFILTGSICLSLIYGFTT